jgi:uncharacterized protein with FMN-binding domain
MKKKRMWIILLAIVLIFSGIIGVSIWRGANQLEAITVSDINLSQIPDGVYNGRKDTMAIKVQVSVTVNEGRITDIDILEHNNGRGDAAETIVDDVVAQQTLMVDAVSGATLSSKVILKAVENALSQTAK